MLKALVLGFLLLMSSGLKAEEAPGWMADSTARFSAGFLAGMVSDYVVRRPAKEEDKVGFLIRYCLGKVSIGVAGGILLEGTRATIGQNRDFDFGAIGWGALGGLTTVVFHF